MICKFSVIIFLVIFSFTEASDDRNIYTLVTADGHATNNVKEEVRFAEYGDQDLVQVSLYYESMCPYCRDFDTTDFAPTIQALSPYLNIGVYPYGNAKVGLMSRLHFATKPTDLVEYMKVKTNVILRVEKLHSHNNTKEVDGKPVITCQHGPEECYGNMLHACAIDNLKNLTEAVLYNACMMDPSKDVYGSNDKRATECGKSMNIDPKPIMACAKGDKGLKLLYEIGQESSKVHYKFVPYPLINGQFYNQENDTTGAYMKAVCAAFKNPPPPCTNA